MLACLLMSASVAFAEEGEGSAKANISSEPSPLALAAAEAAANASDADGADETDEANEAINGAETVEITVTDASEAADAETDDAEGADDAETATSTRAYSTPTPVGGEDNSDNTVNTHQLPDSSFLYDTSLTELASATSYYDGQTVQITGEAIGDIIREGTDGTHVWVTLASTSPTSDATIVVYLSTSDASIIDTLGAYGKTGTILQVRGTFHLVCPDHEGTSDIHVENVNVVSPGSTSPDTFSWANFKSGILLVVFAGALLLAFHLIRQRLR
mgnify:CR=1 FL=1